MARTIVEQYRHPKHPRLIVQLRASSRFYQVLTFIDGRKQQKSLKVRELDAAFKLAESWYRKVLRASVQTAPKHPVDKLTADPLVGEVFRDYRLTLQGDKRKFADWRWGPIQDFWRTVPLADVGPKRCREFVNWRRRRGPIKVHTLHKYLILIRQILKYAVEQELLPALPPLIRVGKIEPNPRPWLTPSEFEHLTDCSMKRIREAEKLGATRLVEQRQELDDQIWFMMGMCCRVGEMLNLRVRDCRYERRGKQQILLAEMRGKRGVRTVVGGVEAAHIAAFRSEDKQPDDLVVPVHHRDGFKELLKAAGLYRDAHGYTRNFKSLRATAISFRVMQPDANLLLISRNAGVALGVIDSYYARRLSAEAGRDHLSQSVVKLLDSGRASR